MCPDEGHKKIECGNKYFKAIASLEIAEKNYKSRL